MASIKRLKKDIDYLTFSVVADCFNYSIVTGKTSNNVSEIVQNIINSRNDLRKRVCEGKRVVKGERKNYYKAIFKDLLVNVDGAFTKLSETVKEN